MNIDSIKKWHKECHDALNGEIIDTLLAEVKRLEKQHEATIPIVYMARVAELENKLTIATEALERIIYEADEYYDSPANSLVTIARAALERIKE